MIIDTSALVAITRREPDRETFVAAALSASVLRMSAGTLVEAQIILEAEAGTGELDRVLHELGVEIVPVDAAQAKSALDGFRLFGKGRHPAALNFGDLFSYALAKTLDEPLLFKGNDFIRTDVVPALPDI